MKNNKIPRNFKTITGKMLISTNANNEGDIIEVVNNDNGNGYTLTNIRTQEKFHCFISMIRNAEIFELTDVK